MQIENTGVTAGAIPTLSPSSSSSTAAQTSPSLVTSTVSSNIPLNVSTQVNNLALNLAMPGHEERSNQGVDGDGTGNMATGRKNKCGTK